MDTTVTQTSMAELAAQMLTENTGVSVVDSGGIYGRPWQRNQGKDFESEPSTTVDWQVYNGRLQGYTASISLYHWLKLNFEPDAEMQAAIDADEDGTWFDTAEKIATEFSTEREPEVTYTYNSPSDWDLSQDIQFWEVYTDDDYEPTHLIVMVHGGCDARWGFTKPYALKITHEYWRDAARVDSIHAAGFNWYSDGGYGAAFVCDEIDERDFFTLPVVVMDDNEEWVEYQQRVQRNLSDIHTTTLSLDQKAQATSVMRTSCEGVKGLLLLEQHVGVEVPAVVIDGRDVQIFWEGEFHEITAGNCYL
jgi:hypothetical protein